MYRQGIARTMNRLLTPAFGSITGVRTKENVAALTFDDGPHPVFTPMILDVLAAHDAKATFFVLGAAAAREPALISQIVDAGHELGNHSWDHPSLPLVSGLEIRSQLARTRSCLAPNAIRLMRPPFGDQSLRTYVYARLLGYEVVVWHAHAEDWLDHDDTDIAAKLSRRLKPGVILLLHDRLHDALEERFHDRLSTVRALEGFLSAHPDFRFLTVSEMMRKGRTTRRMWFKTPEPQFLNRLKRGPV